MRFLLDEGVPWRLGAHLDRIGHDARAVGRDYPHALSDHDILRHATDEGRGILTNDKDFGDLIFRDGLRYAGVILFRLGYATLDDRIADMERILTDHSEHLDQFIVVSHQGIRVRASRPTPPYTA